MVGQILAEVAIDHSMPHIEQWGECNGYGKFVDVIDDPHSEHLAQLPVAKDIKGNTQYHEGINKLGDERGSSGP